MTSICDSNSEILNNHPTCKAECNKLLAMKDSEYAKLKLECRMATKKFKDLEQENKALSAELRKMKHLTCTLQCEVQSLLEKCTTELTTTYPYMEEPSTYICQTLQPRNNETKLAELLRVEKAICARYKAKADTVDRLERELAALKAQAASKRHDMIFNVNVQGRHNYPAENLTPAEIDAQGTDHSVSGSRQCGVIGDTPLDDETLQSNQMHWNRGSCNCNEQRWEISRLCKNLRALNRH